MVLHQNLAKRFKKYEKADLAQCLECTALKRCSKYTTLYSESEIKISSLNLNCLVMAKGFLFCFKKPSSNQVKCLMALGTK